MKLDAKLMAAIISAIEAYLQMKQGQLSLPPTQPGSATGKVK